MSLETRKTPLNTVSMYKHMFLDNNKTIAVEQDGKKNINLILSTIIAGFAFHITTATCIGIVTGW